MTVLDEPGDVAAHRRQHEREERREHRDRARDERAAEQPGEDERRDRDDGDAETEDPHLVEAAVVVATAVEAERQSDDALEHDRDRDRRGDTGLVHRTDLHVVAHERRQRNGDGPRRRVDDVLDQREDALQPDRECGPPVGLLEAGRLVDGNPLSAVAAHVARYKLRREFTRAPRASAASSTP